MPVVIDALVATERQKYDGISNVALVGGDGAARIVVGSLLFYCMKVYWASRRQKIHPVATSAGRRLWEALEGMKKGRYPRAAIHRRPGTIIAIHYTSGGPSRCDIVLDDASGVDPAGLLAGGGDPSAGLGAPLPPGHERRPGSPPPQDPVSLAYGSV